MEKRYHCPVELAVDVIGGRWRPVIRAHLKEGAILIRPWNNT